MSHDPSAARRTPPFPAPLRRPRLAAALAGLLLAAWPAAGASPPAGGAAAVDPAAPADPWAASGPWLTFRGEGGPGDGLRVVLVSGDEEYRSEEGLPQLARILAERHGFTCRVLFAIDPETGHVNPDERTHLPGLAALADADLMIIQTRFRDLPDEAMRHVDDYVRSGRPVVGLRTATHAFALRDGSAFAGYGWNHGGERWPGGFGRGILGETWIAHHGSHSREGTRGRTAPGAGDHPILRGIPDGGVFADTNVYGVRLPLPEDCEPLMLAEVTATRQADAPAVDGPKNDPMMPLAWIRRMPVGGAGEEVDGDADDGDADDGDADDGDAGGAAERRVFTTTLGSSVDLADAGSRRLVLHGAFWALGLEDAIPAAGIDVGIVGDYEPTPQGFGGFRRGVRPSDLPGWEPPAAEEGAGAADPGSSPTARLELPDGGTLLVAGGTMAERIAQSGALAALAHAAHPGRTIRVREIPWSGDEAGVRPRETNVPGVRDWILALEADAVVACFGMTESFAGPAGLEGFRRDLEAFVAMVRAARGPAVDVTLVSPLAHEDLGAPWPTGEAIATRRRDLAAYAAVVRDVAASAGTRFVDLLAATDPLAAGGDAPLTSNGIHPGESASVLLAGRIAAALGWLGEDAVTAAAGVRAAVRTGAADPAADPAAAEPSLVRRLAVDAHHLWRQRYRPTNTEYVWGRRRDPFGSVSFPPEMAQLERMIAARERAIAAAGPVDPAGLLDRMTRVAAAAEAADRPSAWELAPSAGRLPEDDWTPPAVEARGTETSLGATDIASPAATIAESLTVADGYVVACFASEADFPELANPLAATFDDRGRLWVLCAPTYPHPLPGTPPASRLIVLEDADGDGRADASSTFAGGLSTPTGFAIAGDGSVYLGEAPDLLRLRDTDGDGRADRREIVASGFSMPDSHHQISAFEWAPDGGLLLHEGVFGVGAVETPWGTIRVRDAAVWRLDPRTRRLTVLSHASFANPWGHAFDDWGASVLADASGGDSFAFSHVTTAFTWPDKPRRPGAFLNRGRPTAGAELIASRHFPDDVQDTILVNQSIGFHGTRWDRLVSEPGTSGLRAERMPQDLLASRDVNVRPVALEIGPDGTLVIVDWCNPIIGHMQYSLRDPRRDASHGRIWRVRHAERPLVEPPDVAGADVPALLELLRLPERNTRGLARRRLQAGDPAVVLPAARTWAAAMRARHASAAEPLHDRLLVELMWLHEAHGDGRLDVLDDVLELLEPRGRAAGARSIRRRLQAGTIDPEAAAERLERLARDADMRVRLEAVVACGFLPPARGEAIAVRAADAPMDGPMFTVLEATLAELGRGRAATSDLVRRLRLLRAPAEAVLAEALDDVTASVRLARADLPPAAREAALDRLAAGDAGAGAGGGAGAGAGAAAGTGADAGAGGGGGTGTGAEADADADEFAFAADAEPRRVAVLLAELERARLETTAESVGDLLLARDPGALAAAEPAARLSELAGDERPAVSAAAAAALLRAGDEDRIAALPDDALLAGLGRLPAARPDEPALAAPLARVRRDVALGRLPAAEAVAVVLRHAGPDAASRAPVVAWLGRLAQAGGRLGLDAWGPRHDVAMAALAALHAVPAAEWPVALRLARQPEPSSDVLALGRAVYHDEIVGCLRCHGADGRGLEGYPPLAGSPRLVGDPRVAAGIVVHGLYGPLRTPDGRRFDSVMAPLGASLDDAEVAAVLTWARRAWGNFAPPVDAGAVAEARAAGPPGGTMWTIDELDRRWPAGLVTLLGPRTAGAGAAAGAGASTAPAPSPASAPADGSGDAAPAAGADAGAAPGTDGASSPAPGRGSGSGSGPGPGAGMLLLLFVGGVVVVAILVARSRRAAA